MTGVSQKCQYALRALFELSRRQGEGPIPVGQIAQGQSIPVRFLEVILGQLKQNGFVQSRRGVQGGYMLLRSPSEILVGDVVRAIDGPLIPVVCQNSDGNAPAADCQTQGNCAFRKMWDRLYRAISEVYDGTSFQDLLDEDLRLRQEFIANYDI
jgi:Rrf2 family protein